MVLRESSLYQEELKFQTIYTWPGSCLALVLIM